MPIYYDISGNQIDGARDYQEDAFMISQLGDGQNGRQDALVIMADGMGGHAAGNVASNLATSTFNKSFAGLYPPADVASALNDSLVRANDAISAAVTETPGLSGMGCTMVCVYLTGDKLWWVSVGDSHLYLIRDRGMIKHNADHSYGGYLQLMREQGMEVEPDPKLSPNMLMSAMIGDDISEVDLSEEPFILQPGDRILIASDGLDTLGQGAVIQYSAWSESARDCVEALLQAVVEANQPRQDNTTIIVVDVKEGMSQAGTDAPPPEPEDEGPQDDITQPGGTGSVVEERWSGDPSPPDAAPPAEPPPAEVSALRQPEERAGGSSMLVGIIVVLVLLAGGGAAWFMLGTQPTPESEQTASARRPVLETEPAQRPRIEPEAEVEREAEAEPEVEVEPEAEEKTKPMPEPAVEAEADGLVPGSIIQDSLKGGGKAPEMVVIPAGQFEMGEGPAL